MSDPKRFDPLSDGMWENSAGDYVLHSDYARLKAEVERLDNNCDYLDRELDREIEKTAMLCGQVERLRKAGDAMCKFFDDYGFYGFGFQEAWNAAKEGKPSV